MVKDYGKIIYPPSSVYSGREYINLSFLHKGTNIDICCRILANGFTDRSEVMHFDHPHPPFSRFFIFTEGGAEVTISSEKIELVKGCIYHLPPNLPFDVTYGISKMIFFHLHITDLSGQTLFGNVKEIFKISDDNLFSRYISGFEKNDKLQTFSAIIDTLRIFLKPQLQFMAARAEKAKRFPALFNYIQNKPIARVTVAELAELYSKTPDALSKHFKRTMSISLKKFLLERQLTQAQELLLHSEKTIIEISKELGYSNSQYFQRFFKKHCQCTPGEYRATQYKD